MKKYEQFGVYDFSDFAEELETSELILVNGGSCGGGCGGGSSGGVGSSPKGPSGPTGPTNSPSSSTPSIYGQCGGFVPTSPNERSGSGYPKNVNTTNNDGNWKDLFPDPNNYNYDGLGIDPSKVTTKGKRLSVQESNSAKNEMKNYEATGEYKVEVSHSAYNNGIITLYTLYPTSGKKALVTYIDTNNDGTVDYAQ